MQRHPPNQLQDGAETWRLWQLWLEGNWARHEPEVVLLEEASVYVADVGRCQELDRIIKYIYLVASRCTRTMDTSRCPSLWKTKRQGRNDIWSHLGHLRPMAFLAQTSYLGGFSSRGTCKGKEGCGLLAEATRISLTVDCHALTPKMWADLMLRSNLPKALKGLKSHEVRALCEDGQCIARENPKTACLERLQCGD